MAYTEVMATYIKKLSHPLKEIRERSLQLLVAKLQLGWELQDELAGTRELLEALLAWFHVQQPSLQREALQLLLSTIKTNAGTYIANEFGIKKILTSLNKLEPKIASDALPIYHDVLETLQFLNTVESSEDVTVPPLTLQSLAGSESDETSSGAYYCGRNAQSSKDTSMSNGDSDLDRCVSPQSNDGIKVLLFPWVELCSSDDKTMRLVEDALKLLKSIRRCCRFICDVFLQDFPSEIFLNRPTIIKILLSMADWGPNGRPGDALHVLLCTTRALRSRLLQLSALDLIHESKEITSERKDSVDEINNELEYLESDVVPNVPNEQDALVALKQLPAPIYALDTLQHILTIMARSIALIDPADKEVLNVKETNACLALTENLILLLVDCVSESFWCSEHSTKIQRDIAHKSCMVMRLLGDLLMKYRRSFFEDSNRSHHRVASIRLMSCAEQLLNWARYSAMPPSSVAQALQAAQLDPALDLLYPELGKRICAVLQNSRISINQEYKNKYRMLQKLYSSMEEAANFLKNRNSCRSSKKVLDCIKKSLPVLELHRSEGYLKDVSEILLKKTSEFDMNDNDWSSARTIVLTLMAHNIDWVQARFYRMMAEMVRTVLVGDETNQAENEKCLTLLCDVGILTEICCHGLSSKSKEVESCASDITLYLLRGRLVLSEPCWWRLLASLLPVLPLVHVYAAHDTQLGQAICKSLEPDIAECMGVSLSEVTSGLVRLLFVRCPTVQLDAAHLICRLLDDENYLPPKESLRADILKSAVGKLQPQDFNVNNSSSPSKLPPTNALMQILDVLKQDIVLDEHGSEFVSRSFVTPTLEPSLRRSTLQQLSVIIRQQELHETFLQCDGLKIIVAILRMSMTVDDYLAFPECAISCVSVLNSICFATRHSLAKISDLPLLLIRVILVFPANESTVLMSAQILALVVWSGFVLQELDASRRRVPALPLSVTERTTLPFIVNSYWSTSPNTEHSSIEWLLSDEDARAALRVQWWCASEGGGRVVRGAPPPAAPPALRPTARDLAALRAACPKYSCTKALLDLENATSHKQVNEALGLLESYTHLLPMSSVTSKEFGALPWQHTRRFLCAPPASSRDTTLLISLLRFIHIYMDLVPNEDAALSWIKSSFIGNDASVIALLSRDELYLEQTPQENIELTQLHTHIVKVLLRCIIHLDHHDDYNSYKMESLVKILLACLQRVDLKNFHMLGYLNELVRCIRYALNSEYCKLSEDTLVQCLRLMTAILAGCAAGGGRKGQACRLDALLSLLALLGQIHEERIPVQRWSEAWNGEVVQAVVKCSAGARAELRAAALQVMAALAHHAQLMPHLLQAIPTESLAQFAAVIFSEGGESNIVRSAAATLITALSARASPHTDVLEHDILGQLKEHGFLENCLDILVDFCNEKTYNKKIEPNVPRSLLERRFELEVRAQKCGDVLISPALGAFRGRAPPTAALVAALADVLYNVSGFPRCPVQVCTERGIYRLLFRCASWSKGSVSENHRVRLASCRALTAAASHKCVRVSLATTHDCLLNLLATLTLFDEEIINAECLNARTHGLMLLATLITEKSAGDTLWRALRELNAPPLFYTLLQSLESDEAELQDAALYCLSQLAQSATHKKLADRSKDQSRVEFFDNLKSPYTPDPISDRQGSGDRNGSDCQPEYMAEELCKVLIHLYQKIAVDTKIPTIQDDRWPRVCSCLCAVLSASPRGRRYGVHRALPRTLLLTLQAVRDRLALQGSAQVVRSAAQNPTIHTLHWLLRLIDCHMIDCVPAKESFADDGLAVSLNRLWPWCMLTPELREDIVHLLLNFSNDCAKAWGAMSSCVGNRTLIGEVCALTAREAAQQGRPRSPALLRGGLRALRRAAPHPHCRAIVIKSEVITSVYKSVVRERAASEAGAEWAALVEAVARHADGAPAVLALRPLSAAPALRAALLPALAHLARHRRAAALQAPDILELLSGTLLAGDVAETVSAARAVWALAANNHKAKLQLRSAGVAAAALSALQRVRRVREDAATRRAVQILLYTCSILQAT